MNSLTKEEQEYIRERRFQMAIERFKDYEEYMEIPGYGNDDEIESDLSNTIERVDSFDEYMEDTDFNNNPECIKKLRDFLFQNKRFIPEYNPRVNVQHSVKIFMLFFCI